MTAAVPELPSRWRDALSREEISQLVETNNWRGFCSIALDWGLVAAAMALVAVIPNPLTILLAIALIGTRQLGFAVLMHEAAHHTLFRNRALNDWAGNWLCAYPIWADLRPYRSYHLQHHAKNWTKDDPDLDLATKFPVTRASMRRKIWRDLSGQVGWKRARATLRRDLFDATSKARRENVVTTVGQTSDAGRPGWHNLKGVVLTNLALFALLAAFGHPELMLLWLVAWLTVNSLVTRIRSIAEHAMPTDPGDELRNTRTTLASPWARLFIAPNRVNYHLEHHLLMTVPLHKLPRLHRLLRERGALRGALIARGYTPVLREASARAA
jgi:fatty acid desaturase